MRLLIRGPRSFAELELKGLPLLVGAGADCAIHIEGLPPTAPIAALGVSDDRPYLQPLPPARVLLNGRPIVSAEWLQSGDRITAADISLDVTSSESELTLTIAEPGGAAVSASQAASPPTPRLRPRPYIPAGRLPPAKRPWRRLLRAGALALSFAALSGLAWFLFSARFVGLDIEPIPDHLAMEGPWPRFPVNEGYLLLPGRHSLSATKAGYRPLEALVEVGNERNQSFHFAMTKLPGYLRVHTPGVGARVSVDGIMHGDTPFGPLELPAGTHDVSVTAERYQEAGAEVSIEGGGVEQVLTLQLTPSWAAVRIESSPQGATLGVDGESLGTTPASLDLLAGRHRLELQLQGYKTWSDEITVSPNVPLAVPLVQLEPADGLLRLRSQPSGATVTLGGAYAGRTPVDLPLTPNRDHRLSLSRPGFETLTRTVNIPPATESSLLVPLKAVRGLIRVRLSPADAQLLVDGNPVSGFTGVLELTAVSHEIEARKEGYQSYEGRVVPRPGYEQELDIALLPLGRSGTAAPAGSPQAPDGQAMQRVPAGEFTMGSSRREQGRRSNETRRAVAVTRPFYIAAREVTNAQFRLFQPNHSSGRTMGQDLDSDLQPVVNVTWEDAAGYCNWMSAKASLPEVYEARNGTLVARTPLPTGYRLPTEAEWAWAARAAKGGDQGRFPWGEDLPPPPRAGNFADRSAAALFANTLADFDDGYPATAPPGSFDPNSLGLYDLAGNVAEWVQDYYTIYPATPGTVSRDPLGPESGQHHVVRGSSWMHASLSALRQSFRDYSADKRSDLGFRCARSAEGP